MKSLRDDSFINVYIDEGEEAVERILMKKAMVPSEEVEKLDFEAIAKEKESVRTVHIVPLQIARKHLSLWKRFHSK